MQGSQDIAVHVGTLHFKAKAVIEAFGDDIHQGDVFAINDPYLGGTHFNDVRIIRPIFDDGELIASRSPTGTGRTSAAACRARSTSPPRSTSARACASRPCGSGQQGALPRTTSPADRVQHARARGRPRATCTRRPRPRAWPSARSCGWSSKYGRDTILTAFAEVQDYVERLTRTRRRRAARRRWETEDYIDLDPGREEGLIPIKVKLTIDGDRDALRPVGLAPGGRRRSSTRLRRRLLGGRGAGRRRSSPTCR